MSSKRPFGTRKSRESVLLVGKSGGIASGCSFLHQYDLRDRFFVDNPPPFDFFEHSNNILDMGVVIGTFTLGNELANLYTKRQKRCSAVFLIGLGVAATAVGELEFTKPIVEQATPTATPDWYDFGYGTLAAIGIGSYLGVSRKRPEPTTELAIGPCDFALLTSPEAFKSVPIL